MTASAVFYPNNRHSRTALETAQPDVDRIGVFSLTSPTSLETGDVVVDSDGPESPTRAVAVVAGQPANVKDAKTGAWQTEIPVAGGVARLGEDVDTLTVLDRAAGPGNAA